jgi:S1-C subfamily serine protease
MRAKWLLSSLLLFTTFSGSPPLQAASASLRQAVVRVELDVNAFSFGPALGAELAARQPLSAYESEVLRRLRMGSTGTGFFVNANGDLITNAHVFLSGVRYRSLPFTYSQWDSMARLLSTVCGAWVTVGEGDQAHSYVAVPVAVAEDLDLVLLRVTRPPGDHTTFSYLPIAASGELRVKQPVTALGFSENGFQAGAGTIISLIRGAHVHEEMRLMRRSSPVAGEPPVIVTGTSQGPVVRLQHSAPTGHGSSGGPLLDAKNRVIGVCYAMLADRNQPDSDETDLNLAIASDVLRKFLKDHAIPFTEAAP